MKRLLVTLPLLTATLTTPALASQKLGVREVCARSTYLTVKPGKIYDGTLKKHQTIRVIRYDSSGKYAYGFARGHIL